MQPVAGGHLEVVADAQQEHADHRQNGPQPDAKAGFVADKQADQRHDNHVQAGDETGVGDAGKQQADLLQVDPECQYQPHHGTAEEQAAVAPGLTRNGLFGGGIRQQRQQHQGGQCETQAGIEEGANMVHTQALGDKRRAPDDGGKQHQDIGAQGLVLHNSTRQAKRQTVP